MFFVLSVVWKAADNVAVTDNRRLYICPPSYRKAGPKVRLASLEDAFKFEMSLDAINFKNYNDDLKRMGLNLVVLPCVRQENKWSLL